ncbi:MAG: hypothetical protein MJZ02_08440, partial [Paludibacteraceae bacterium]|nr:hypothetical protein [Paludibacteraceae bacterium]
MNPTDEAVEKVDLVYTTTTELPIGEVKYTTEKEAVTITNSSFAEFCIPETDSICGVPTVEAAYLNWGGRLSDDELAKGVHEVVYMKLNGQDSLVKITSMQTVIGEVKSKNNANAKSKYSYYSCHADVTRYLRAIDKSGKYDLYVANIAAYTKLVTDYGSGFPSTSGWSLDVVLSNGSFPKKNIIIYWADLMQVAGAEGSNGEELSAVFDFNKSDAENKLSYNVQDTITLSYSSFGALNSIKNEAMYWGKEISSDYLIKFDNGHNNQYKGEYNHFNSSVDYKYQTCDIEKKNDYTPGFDLHTYVFSPQQATSHHVKLADGATSFPLTISSSNEHHLLTNVVFVSGAPEAPQVKLLSKTDTSIAPGTNYVDSLYFGVGENKEGLDSLTLTLPISEFVDTLTKLSFKWLVPERLDSKTVNISTNSGAVIITCDTFPQFKIKVPVEKVLYGDLQKDDAFEKARKTINKYLRYVTKYNDSLRMIDPSKFKSARVTFLFSGIVINPSISKKDVFRLDVGMMTKPKGNIVYNKDAYLGQPSSITPEAEIGVRQNKTKEWSVFENTPDANNYWDTYRCTYGTMAGNGGGGGGGGGGGDCASLNKFNPSPQGLFVRDTLHEHINIKAGAECRPHPDTISITICGETEVSLEEINYLLATKGKFDIAAFAKEDSCIWEERKRSELVKFAEKHNVNRSRLEALLSNSDQDAITFAAGKLNESFACSGVDGTVYKRELDSIVNAKVRFSELWALYANKKDSINSEIYDETDLVTVSKKNFDKTYTVSKDTVLYLYYRSPWIDENGDTCAYFIPVHFKKRSIVPPVVEYNGDTLANRDTIFLCLEGEMSDVTIRKSDYELDLYSSMAQVYKEDTLNWVNLHIFDSFDMSYDWNVPGSGHFTSDTSNFTRIAVRQQSFNCKGDSLIFFVSVANMKIDQGPVLEDSTIYVCQTMKEKDSVSLKVEVAEGQEDFEIRWYTKDKIASKNVLIGKGKSINVPKDSAGTFLYWVTFFSNQCESQPSRAVVVVNPLADTISADTIPVCQRYHLTSEDVMSMLKFKNGTAGELSIDKLNFYRYLNNSDQGVEDNVKLSIQYDTVPLAKLLADLDYESSCQEDGARYTYFVAQALTDSGCPGPGSLITIKVNCFENDQPKFGFKGDSILYCMGSKGDANFNNFLSANDEVKKYGSGHKWYWFDAKADNHYTYKFGNTYYKTGENSAPVVDPSFVHSDLITVVRVDSNNCVSKHDTFKVVVDTSINTYPIIADSIIPIADTRFNLSYCMGDFQQDEINIPAVGFPSTEYRVEWYSKDDLSTICKGIDSSDVQVEHVANIKVNNPDTLYYCVRQSTQLGCKGPWLNVQIIVYPDIDKQPGITPAEYCQGSLPVPATVKAENPDVDRFSLSYYRIDTTHVDGVVVKDTVPLDYIVPSTKEAGVQNYLVALKESKTKCRGKFFELPVTINPKPGSVVYDGDSILYYCAGIGDVNLAEEIPAKVNPDDKDTELMWLPSSTLSTDANAKVELGIYQRDTYTGCLGDTTKLVIKVENTFHYTPWPDRSYCWGDTINMCDTINKRIRLVNNYIDSTSIGYVVRRMVGETSAKDTIGYEFVSALHSNAGRHVNNEQSYQLTILDSVSGCLVYDTVTFTFRGLPNIEPSKVEEYCEAFPTKLPTPTDENYTYKWLRENGTESAETVTLDESEVFSLVEYDKFLCSDTFKVEVNVHKNPKAAPVQDLKLCKDGLELFLSDVVRPDDEHLAANLQVQYFNHVGESMGYDVNTDTIAMAGLKRVLTFTARQTDLIYGCYTDTTFKIELTKGLELQAPDMEAVCEPDTVSLSKHIKNYLNQNLGAVNLPNLSGVVIEYGRLSGPMATRVTEEEANELTYVADHDSVKYMYRVIDAESVCSSTDTLFVVINKQPETPLVEGGADSLFFCAGNDPFKIGAENKNSATISSANFWNAVSELEPTDSITVDKDVNLKSYSAYSKNLKTGCISTSDTVAVVIANAIKVSPIAKNDTLELCANEVMDVAKAAVASFTFDLKYQSDTTILAEVDGLTIPMQTLTAVTSTVQDTTEYIFTAKDELTQCEATNRLVLIFHQKPVVKIDAPTVVCQDTTALLKAVGEKRPVTYAWYMDDANTVASTAGSLTVPSVQVPHSFKLVETLKGTLCADSTTFALDVVTTPNPFADSAFVFCQQNEEELIKFSRPEADDVYNIEWTEDKESVVSSDVKLAVDLSKDTAYVRYARQVNEAKGLACPSEWAKADIKINKHIEVTLPDTFICSPLSFNLAQFANKRKTESSAGYQLAIDRVYLVEGLGSPKSVEDSSKVAKAGKYQINYLDKNGCESQATTKLKFIPKPLTPEVSVDSILLCQGVDTFITVK